MLCILTPALSGLVAVTPANPHASIQGRAEVTLDHLLAFAGSDLYDHQLEQLHAGFDAAAEFDESLFLDLLEN